MKTIRDLLAVAVQALGKLEGVIVSVNIILVLAMMVIVVYGVIFRYALKAPVGWVSEISELMMVALAFMVMAYIQYKRQHIRVDFLILRQSERTRLIAGIITTLCAFAIFVLVTKAGWDYAAKAQRLGFKSEELGYPLFPLRLLVPASSLLMCLQLLADFGQQVSQLSRLRTKGKVETRK